jgi:hypothetical protein
VAQRDILASNAEVRRAAGNALGFIGGGYPRGEGFKQIFQRRTMGVLGGVACLKLALDLSAINVDRAGGDDSPALWTAQDLRYLYHIVNRRAITFWPGGLTGAGPA